MRLIKVPMPKRDRSAGFGATETEGRVIVAGKGRCAFIGVLAAARCKRSSASEDGAPGIAGRGATKLDISSSLRVAICGAGVAGRGV